MTTFPRYAQDATWDNAYIDLRNVPREQVTVTVTVEDEKLKCAIFDKIAQLRECQQNAVHAQEWGVVHRCAMKMSVLEEMLKKANG